jgi:hypothetical protein
MKARTEAPSDERTKARTKTCSDGEKKARTLYLCIYESILESIAVERLCHYDDVAPVAKGVSLGGRYL